METKITVESMKEDIYLRCSHCLKTFNWTQAKVRGQICNECKKEKVCPICKSDDTYLTNLRDGFNYRCNNCGDYFK